jgi:hypothetical protein
MMDLAASETFNGDLTVTVNGEVDAVTMDGIQLPALSVDKETMLLVCVSRMLHGTQHRVAK